ncbi:MAG: hypothetical protein ACSHYB_12875 [Roseibacillus sp.]
MLQFSNDFSEIDALFTPLAEGILNAGTVNQSPTSGDQLVINDFSNPGDIFGNITDTDGSYLAAGSALFLWVFNSEIMGDATEWAIVGSTDSSWMMPEEEGSTTLTPQDVDTILRGSGAGPNILLETYAVPEPSVVLLGCLSASVLLGRRRT